jgi:hypothetical protein
LPTRGHLFTSPRRTNWTNIFSEPHLIHQRTQLTSRGASKEVLLPEQPGRICKGLCVVCSDPFQSRMDVSAAVYWRFRVVCIKASGNFSQFSIVPKHKSRHYRCQEWWEINCFKGDAFSESPSICSANVDRSAALKNEGEVVEGSGVTSNNINDLSA